MRVKRGWLRDLPDHRDYSIRNNDEVALLLKEQPNAIKTSVDLRPLFSPIVDQGDLGSCTANAAAGIIEYYWLNIKKQYTRASRLFLYHCARRLGGYFPGDNGAEIRNVMGALVINGAPPEKYWPYSTPRVDTIPDNFIFSMGQSLQATRYVRLNESDRNVTLTNIKRQLSNGNPVIFGFTCYSSMDLDVPVRTGEIPYPSANEQVVGGHAVVFAGYDDNKVITNPIDGSKTTGALIFRNSWGTGWGTLGYGWIPYKYVTVGLATDFWVLLSAEWLNIAQFV